ncbi:MAG TPA: alpha/beta hydrolase, partial [Thermoleophilaceae bacterium]|nr:alpha/beta hydrolase [Thermoleophilaceae bacterium]
GGRSSDVPSDFGLVDYADCLAALIEALALGPAHVVDISWGGTLVQELYRHHPELIATLVLVDTYAGWKGSLPPEEVRARVTGAYRALAVPAEEFDPARALPGWFARDPPTEFVPLLEEMAAAVRPASMRTALRLMAEADQRDLLPRIAVPTLPIWGELDARSPLSVARQFEQAIPDTKLVVIPPLVMSAIPSNPSHSTTLSATSAAPTRRVYLESGSPSPQARARLLRMRARSRSGVTLEMDDDRSKRRARDRLPRRSCLCGAREAIRRSALGAEARAAIAPSHREARRDGGSDAASLPGVYALGGGPTILMPWRAAVLESASASGSLRAGNRVRSGTLSPASR